MNQKALRKFLSAVLCIALLMTSAVSIYAEGTEIEAGTTSANELAEEPGEDAIRPEDNDPQEPENSQENNRDDSETPDDTGDPTADQEEPEGSAEEQKEDVSQVEAEQPETEAASAATAQLADTFRELPVVSMSFTPAVDLSNLEPEEVMEKIEENFLYTDSFSLSSSSDKKMYGVIVPAGEALAFQLNGSDIGGGTATLYNENGDKLSSAIFNARAVKVAGANVTTNAGTATVEKIGNQTEDKPVYIEVTALDYDRSNAFRLIAGSLENENYLLNNKSAPGFIGKHESAVLKPSLGQSRGFSNLYLRSNFTEEWFAFTAEANTSILLETNRRDLHFRICG